MEHYTIIHCEINDFTAIIIFLIIFIEHCIIVHFAPEIKKFIKEKAFKHKEFRGLGHDD